jgi:hypothetical protein
MSRKKPKPFGKIAPVPVKDKKLWVWIRDSMDRGVKQNTLVTDALTEKMEREKR